MSDTPPSITVYNETGWKETSMARSNTAVDLTEDVAHLETLEDPRSTINLLHPLGSPSLSQQ